MVRSTRRIATVLAVVALWAAGLLPGTAPARAEEVQEPRYLDVAKWWQHEKVVWKTGWRSSPALVADDEQWHENHPGAGELRHGRWHRILQGRWREAHFHKGMGWQTGKATWYDWYGAMAACGVRLHDNFAASRKFPCGSMLSVRYQGRYTIVEVQDTGPWGDYSRIIDLNPKSFGHLAQNQAGVIGPVKITLLHPRAVRQL